MAPNIGIKSAPSEALDHYLSQHGGHSSLELLRDEKIRDGFPAATTHAQVTASADSAVLGPAGEPTSNEDNTDPNAAAQSASDLGENLEIILAYSNEQPTYEQAAVKKERPRTTGQHRRGKSFYSAQEGKILPLYNEDANESGQITKFAEVDPKESLMPHHESISHILQKQQGELLEKALKETESIAREEQEWAVVEKQLAEDLSFTKTIGELLQSADFQQHNDYMAEEESLPLLNRRVIPFGDGAHLVLPISMLPKPSDQPQANLFNPMNTAGQQSTPFEQIALRGTAISAEIPIEVSSHMSKPVSHSVESFPTSDNVGLPSASIETVIVPETKSNIESVPKPIAKRIPISVTTSRTRSKTTKRRSSLASTTQTPSETLNIEEIQSQTTPGAVTRIPEFSPEAMANIDLINGDITEPFLRDQGVRALSSEPKMTAGGKHFFILFFLQNIPLM